MALAEIRRRKAKLERLEKVVLEADADDLALLRLLLPRDQNESEMAKGAAEQRAQASEPDPPAEASMVQPAVAVQKPRRLPQAVKRGLLDQQVRSAVALLKKGINVRTVFGVLDKNHFHFGARNPRVAIGSVLRKLQKKGVIREVAAASGRRPAEYELRTLLG